MATRFLWRNTSEQVQVFSTLPFYLYLLGKILHSNTCYTCTCLPNTVPIIIHFTCIYLSNTVLRHTRYTCTCLPNTVPTIRRFTCIFLSNTGHQMHSLHLYLSTQWHPYHHTFYLYLPDQYRLKRTLCTSTSTRPSITESTPLK